MNFQDLKIITGGQTGVDRAALDFAIKNGILCGGYCPKGRKAEDGIIPTTYPLTEIQSGDYQDRTEMNIKHSDGTLIISINQYFDKGTSLTKRLCNQHSKPSIVVDLDQSYLQQINSIQSWITECKLNTINIAGPRESALPGIYVKTMEFLEVLIDSNANPV